MNKDKEIIIQDCLIKIKEKEELEKNTALKIEKSLGIMKEEKLVKYEQDQSLSL